MGIKDSEDSVMRIEQTSGAGSTSFPIPTQPRTTPSITEPHPHPHPHPSLTDTIVSTPTEGTEYVYLHGSASTLASDSYSDPKDRVSAFQTLGGDCATTKAPPQEHQNPGGLTGLSWPSSSSFKHPDHNQSETTALPTGISTGGGVRTEMRTSLLKRSDSPPTSRERDPTPRMQDPRTKKNYPPKKRRTGSSAFQSEIGTSAATFRTFSQVRSVQFRMVPFNLFPAVRVCSRDTEKLLRKFINGEFGKQDDNALNKAVQKAVQKHKPNLSFSNTCRGHPREPEEARAGGSQWIEEEDDYEGVEEEDIDERVEEEDIYEQIEREDVYEQMEGMYVYEQVEVENVYERTEEEYFCERVEEEDVCEDGCHSE